MTPTPRDPGASPKDKPWHLDRAALVYVRQSTPQQVTDHQLQWLAIRAVDGGTELLLEFLHRRFSLARDLLTEDGVILVSINDENRAKLEHDNRHAVEEAAPGATFPETGNPARSDEPAEGVEEPTNHDAH